MQVGSIAQYSNGTIKLAAIVASIHADGTANLTVFPGNSAPYNVLNVKPGSGANEFEVISDF